MLKFPQLLLLLIFAAKAHANLSLGGLADDQTLAASGGGTPMANGAPLKYFAATGNVAGGLNFQFVAIPEPGVFVALISGGAILLSRRRR